MRINEILVESQQLDEGPFTQAIGKVGGKIAKGVANIGKDLKTGFKAGYSGEQPAAAPAAAAPAAAAPAKKAGGGIIDKIKQGFAQGQGEQPAAAPAAAAPAAASAAAPAATTAPEVEKAAKIGVGQINKIIPTLRTRDLVSLQANLEKAIAGKKKAAPAAQAVDPAAAPAAATSTPGEQKVTYGTSDGKPETFTKAADGGWTSDLSGASTVPGDAYSKEIERAYNKSIKQKAAKPSQSEIDADRERNIGMTSDSVIRKGSMMAEGFSLYRKH